jgi:2-hydroxycyclohexanecarboxyl-CoA dehydrogenase
MMKRLGGKVAIVTGAGGGIGKGIARMMADEGARVVVADIRLPAAQKVAESIQAAGGTAMSYQLDVTRYNEAREMVNLVIDRWGQVDILVNNAGWNKFEYFAQSSEETWDKIIAINFKGTLNCCHAVWQYFLDRKYGKIINIGSDAGRVGTLSGSVVYSGTKGAIMGLTKSLAREGAAAGVNVNCICPGQTETDLFQQVRDFNQKTAENMIKAIPLGRMTLPEDVAYAVVYFASDESAIITGQILSVSGGSTMV